MTFALTLGFGAVIGVLLILLGGGRSNPAVPARVFCLILLMDRPSRSH
ncbi:hypothetical protein ACFWB0_02805 [Rhodococcus sp. NPDC060086]